jgi:uncharacterized protein YdaU (DUF1376 family)
MSDIPYLPLYVNDYEGDTAHLSLEEDGAYSRLIRLCWRTSGCSVPNDCKWIMKRMRATQEEYDTIIKPIISDYFTIKKGRVFQKRLQQEFNKISTTISERKRAGKKGGKAKALNNKKKKPSNTKDLLLAKSYHPEPYLEPELEEERKIKTIAKKPTRMKDDWVLPEDYLQWVKDEGVCQDDAYIKKQGEEFKDYWLGVSGQKGTKLDWMATWRNHCRKDWKASYAELKKEWRRQNEHGTSKQAFRIL